MPHLHTLRPKFNWIWLLWFHYHLLDWLTYLTIRHQEDFQLEFVFISHIYDEQTMNDRLFYISMTKAISNKLHFPIVWLSLQYVYIHIYYVQKGHLLQCIQRYKQIFIEPTNKDEFAQAMEQYYAMVNDHTSNGAIFCGVCRGKVWPVLYSLTLYLSERFSWSNCIIILGL